MVIRKWGVVFGVLVAGLGVGCGDSTTPDGGADGSTDSGHDSGRDMMVVDVGPPDLAVDLGTDLGDVDLGLDAGTDLGDVDLGDVDLGVDMDIDAGDDMSVVMMDAGPPDLGDDLDPMDAGPPDLGTDAGPPPPPPPPGAFIRVANLVANLATNPCFCLGISGSYAGAPLETTNIGDYINTGLPYPAVSDYYLVDESTVTGGGLEVSLYDPGEIGSDCSAGLTVFGSMSPLPLVTGHTYTLAWVGLFDDGWGLPAICGAGFTSACPPSAATRLVLIEDDVTAPAGTSTKARVVHAIPNVGNVDVCWDPDGAGGMAAQSLATNLAFGAASPYATPSAIAAGSVLVYTTSSGATCAAHPGSPLLTLPVPFAAPAGTLTFSTTTVGAGSVHSLFADGWLPSGSGNPPRIVPFTDAHP